MPFFILKENSEMFDFNEFAYFSSPSQYFYLVLFCGNSCQRILFKNMLLDIVFGLLLQLVQVCR